MRSSWRRRLLVVALVATAFVLARYTVFRPALVPVTVFRAARGRVEEAVTNSKSGTVKSRRRATLSPEIGGRVAELPVRKGEHVLKGDLLLRLADAEYRANVELQSRSLEAAVATEKETCRSAQLAEQDLSRNRTLVREGIAPKEVLDRMETRRDAASAACDAGTARARQAESALTLARVNLEKTVLRAPFGAVVAEVTTELGEWITPSPPGLPIPPVVELIDGAAIYVSAPIDEVDVGKARSRLPVRITMDAFSGKSFGGRVVRVAPYVVDRLEENRTFEIEVEFDDMAFARTIPPGISADVEVILAAKEDALRIPSYALIEGNRVLVLRGEKLVAAAVKTGLRNWEFTEIVEGLAAGDPVVVSLDRAEVKEGATVRIERETVK